MFSVFVSQKVIADENVRFTDHESGIRFPDCSKLAISLKNSNDVTIHRHELIVKAFWRFHVSFVKLSYCFKFHVNIITDEIRNTPVWVLPNIWRLGWVKDTKFRINFSDGVLLNYPKREGYSLYFFLSYLLETQ